jgi:RNA polymerase sigma-70 factor (ECF subfamily)
MTLGDLLYADRTSPIPEDDWVQLVRSTAIGNQHALRALYERTHRLVFTLAIRITKSRDSAEEVTLDVFRDVWLRAVQYDPKNGSVVGWIMNQARSRAIDRLRLEHRKKRSAGPLDSCGEEHASSPEEVTQTERRRVLERALTALTPEERRTIETAFFGELTYAEAAARLDEPLGTVKTRIRSALAKLRQALSREEDAP